MAGKSRETLAAAMTTSYGSNISSTQPNVSFQNSGMRKEASSNLKWSGPWNRHSNGVSRADNIAGELVDWLSAGEWNCHSHVPHINCIGGAMMYYRANNYQVLC